VGLALGLFLAAGFMMHRFWFRAVPAMIDRREAAMA
jgi:hypothetical protein